MHCKFAICLYRIQKMNTKNKKLDIGYQAMAADAHYEADATEWIGGLQSNKNAQLTTVDELGVEPSLDWSKAEVVTFPNLKRTIKSL